MNDTTNAVSETSTSTKTPSVGERIFALLTAKAKRQKQGVTKVGMTATEIAEAIGISTKNAYDRAYWLAKREGRLVMTGSGKAATFKVAPAKKAEAPAQPVEATPES